MSSMEKVYYEEDPKKVEQLIADINDYVGWTALDLETTGLDPLTDKITHIVLSLPHWARAVVLGPQFVPLLARLQTRLVLQNFKFDYAFLYRAGVDLRLKNEMRDIMLLDHLIDENQEHGLDAQVQREFNDDYKEKFWSTYSAYEEAPFDAQIDYAGHDAIYTSRLHSLYLERCDSMDIPRSLIEHVHNLALKLYDTEIKGIRVDVDYTMAMGEQLKREIAEAIPKMRAATELQCQMVEMDMYVKELDKRKTNKGKAGVKKPEFNFDSPSQQKELIYGKLGVTPIKFKGSPTLNAAALEMLTLEHPLIPMLADYKTKPKVYGTFIKGTLEHLVGDRIYPSFHVNGTVTGRISSSKPNMQQLPKEGGVRGIYVPDPGYKFITADYAQLEVTMAAHFSQDKNLLRIVHEGASQHDITAEGLGVARDLAKRINFAMQYGATVYKIMEILKCAKGDAKYALDKYWETYSGLKKLIDVCHRKVHDGQPIINPYGRRRHFPTTFESKGALHKAERQAFNALTQGTGADITHASFYSIPESVFEVHDEVVAMARSEQVEEVRDRMERVMVAQGKPWLTLPLSVDVSEGLDRWIK